MKSSWIGIGFSHHSVPSLSKVASRSSAGTSLARSTNSAMACFAGPWRQLDSSEPMLMVRTLWAAGRLPVIRIG
jgi:hypothetical protein